MMTAGGTKERAEMISVISVTPNYTGDESGLWVTGEVRAPLVGKRFSVNA